MIAQLANCAWAGMAIRDVVRKSQKRSAPIKEPEPKKTSTKRTCITLITRLSALAIGSIITAVTLFKIDFKKRNFSWPILATEMGITIAGFTIGEVLEKFLYSKANASNSNKTWIALEKISNLHSVVTGLATCFHQYAPTNLLAILSLIPFGPFIGFNASHQYRLFKKEEAKPTEESQTLPGTPRKQLTTSEKAKKIGWKIFHTALFGLGIFLCFQPNFKNNGKSIACGEIVYQISHLIDRKKTYNADESEQKISTQYSKTKQKVAKILRYPIFYFHLLPSAIMNYCKSYLYSPYSHLSPSTTANFLITLYVFGGILYAPYRYSNNHHKIEESEDQGIIRFDVLVNTGAARVAS
jgi:hypothetical protein